MSAPVMLRAAFAVLFLAFSAWLCRLVADGAQPTAFFGLLATVALFKATAATVAAFCACGEQRP